MGGVQVTPVTRAAKLATQVCLAAMCSRLSAVPLSLLWFGTQQNRDMRTAENKNSQRKV